MITIKHIADALGLAHTTVSRALNDHPQISDETKVKVREAAERLGYVPNSGARLMRNGSSSLIGLIVPDVQNEFFSAVARALANQCAASGYQLTLGISEDDPQREQQHVQTLMEGRAQGVMIAPCGKSSAVTKALLQQMPTVQLLRFDPSLGALGLSVDDVGGMGAATRHLLDLGHRRIGFIGGSQELSTGVGRLEGYKTALNACGIEFDPGLVKSGPTLPAFGYDAVRDLLRSDPAMTALILASSRQLLGGLKALREGKVAIPDRLSVVGYGDTEWFEVCHPPITGMSLPVKEMGQQAASLLFSALEGSGQASAVQTKPIAQRIFKPELILRESTGIPLAH